MKIYRTFDKQTKGVYLAQFVNCTTYKTPSSYEDELSKSLDILQDPLFVRKSINTPGSGWKKGKHKEKSLQKLTSLVLKELDDLLEDINYILDQSQEESLDWLLDNFKPLSKNDLVHKPERIKMYTYPYGSLLRLYGVQVGLDCVIITGISIKLARYMQDGKLTQIELNKMDYLRSWLLDNNITNCDQLIEE